MKRILTILLFCFCASLQAQKYDNFLDFNKELILENFAALCRNNAKYTNSIKDSAGILKIELNGQEKINCQFHFDSMGYCDNSQFIYACDACSEKHIDEFVNDRYYGWIKQDPSTYYSKRKRKMKMEVFNSNPAATVIIFTKTNWTKKKYKELIKKQ